MPIFSAILRLTRLDSSLLGFLAIFLPVLIRTKNLSLTLGRAIPLLFISICTFIANDLDDIEKDRVNHPERPLPAGHISPTTAAVLYFGSLGVALFSTKYYVAPGSAFWYYALFILSISYGYVVDCLPSFKAPYVAAAISVPVLIVASSYPDEPRLYVAAGSVFLLALGREICMDIKDRAGDATAFIQSLRPRPLAIAAFSLQMAGLLLLTIQIRRPGDVIVMLTMTALLILSSVYWFKFAGYRGAIILMKIQFFAGLYFLT